MGKGARTRRLKQQQQQKQALPAIPGVRTGEIKLQNPVAQHFPTFIVANALVWEAMMYDRLVAAAPDAAASLEPFDGILGFLAQNARPDEAKGEGYDKWMRFRELLEEHCADDLGVVREGSAKGQHVVICGAGPTLRDHAAEWCGKADQVWGVNSALPWLHANGHKVTHGLTVDQTPHMCAEWFNAPDVEYLVATTIHPHLADHLTKRGRAIRYFNNFVGLRQRPVIGLAADGTRRAMDYETWLYSILFQGTIRAGSGLNSVTRAIDVAFFMGFDRVTVLGADCALRAPAPLPESVERGSDAHVEWLKTVEMHADGGNALSSDATPLTFGGEIDGRHWTTKPDMMVSAVWLRKMANRWAPRLELIGDTLPNALAGKDEAFLARLPTLTDATGKAVPIDVEPCGTAGQRVPDANAIAPMARMANL